MAGIPCRHCRAARPHPHRARHGPPETPRRPPDPPAAAGVRDSVARAAQRCHAPLYARQVVGFDALQQAVIAERITRQGPGHRGRRRTQAALPATTPAPGSSPLPAAARVAFVSWATSSAPASAASASAVRAALTGRSLPGGRPPPDRASLEAVTAAGHRPPRRWRRSYGRRAPSRSATMMLAARSCWQNALAMALLKPDGSSELSARTAAAEDSDRPCCVGPERQPRQ